VPYVIYGNSIYKIVTWTLETSDMIWYSPPCNVSFSLNKLRWCEQMSSRISGRSFDCHDTRNATRCAVRSSRTHSGPCASWSLLDFSSGSFSSCARAGGGIGPGTSCLVLEVLFTCFISRSHRSHLPRLVLQKVRPAVFLVTWSSSRSSSILCIRGCGGCLWVVT